MKAMKAEPLMEEKKELEVVIGSPYDMINRAINSGSDLEKLEKLLCMQERWEANEARKAFNRAMAEFKKNPPDIEKDKKVSFGNTKYSHATLSNVTEKINAALSVHGLSASWTVHQNGAVSVTCKITHVQGHSEETTLTAAADTSGSKNSIQAIGSTITYLERYSLLALTGLATHDMDDDGRASSGEVTIEKITKEEVNSMMDHLLAVGSSVEKFTAYMKLDKLEDMPKSEAKRAWAVIEAVKARRAK